MLSMIRAWLGEDHEGPGPAGHWAMELSSEHRLIGGCSRSFGTPGSESLKLRWVLSPTAWGHGYATGAGDAWIHWAMHEGSVHEVCSLVQPDSARAGATARRMRMEWVSETGHYGDVKLQVYRIRHGDLCYREASGSEVAPPPSHVVRTDDRSEARPRSPARGPRSES